jgi:hypothetical protein
MSLLNILGGIDTISDDSKVSIATLGGFDKKMAPTKHNIIIGNKMKTFVKNTNTEWQTFKDVYYKDGKLEPKYYDKLINVMNNIFPMPLYSESDRDLVYMISTMYNSTSTNICIGMENHLQLLYPIKSTIRYSFMTWKVLFEKLIELFSILRTQYISKHKLGSKNKENNFDELVDRWVSIDNENMTNTSSPILFFNFPPADVNIEDSIPKLNWEIKGSSDQIKKAINEFMKKVKSNEFIYKGYCGNVVIERYMLLMQFPYNNLLKIILLLNNNYDYSNINKQFLTTKKELNTLHKQFDHIKTYKHVTINKMQVPTAKSFPKNPPDKIKFYEKYINAYLNMYNQLTHDFIKKEKLICDASVSLNVLTNDLYKLIELFDKSIPSLK